MTVGAVRAGDGAVGSIAGTGSEDAVTAAVTVSFEAKGSTVTGGTDSGVEFAASDLVAAASLCADPASSRPATDASRAASAKEPEIESLIL